MRVLVTGDAGYIGPRTCVALLAAGHQVTVLDNLCNSSPVALERVQGIAGPRLASLGRRAQPDLAALCEDAWRWQAGNPQGYALEDKGAP